nr:protein BPS1, chloroplastic-like [Ipomoea batatas]
MVLSVHKLSHFLKTHSKLENQHRNPDAGAGDDGAVLSEFRSGVSSFLNRIALGSSETPGSEFWTLGRVGLLLEGLCLIHKEFVKTVARLNHPLSVWGPAITDEYLSFSFHLLGLLNQVSSSISHLNQARLSLSFALSQSQHHSPPHPPPHTAAPATSTAVAVTSAEATETVAADSAVVTSAAAAKNLRKILPQDLQKDFNLGKANWKQLGEEIPDNKERAIHESLMITKRVSFWLLGAVLSGLSSDLKPFMELRKWVMGSDQEPLLLRLDCVFTKEVTEKKQSAVKEVKEINEMVAKVVSAAMEGGDDSAAKELGKQLQRFEEQLEGMRKQTDNLFKEVLAARSGLVDGLRCSSSG